MRAHQIMTRPFIPATARSVAYANKKHFKFDALRAATPAGH